MVHKIIFQKNDFWEGQVGDAFCKLGSIQLSFCKLLQSYTVRNILLENLIFVWIKTYLVKILNKLT